MDGLAQCWLIIIAKMFPFCPVFRVRWEQGDDLSKISLLHFLSILEADVHDFYGIISWFSKTSCYQKHGMWTQDAAFGEGSFIAHTDPNLNVS